LESVRAVKVACKKILIINVLKVTYRFKNLSTAEEAIIHEAIPVTGPEDP
jgi:hypothetical protein